MLFFIYILYLFIFIYAEWLNWRVGGPGNGFYTMYVRGIDPAGNRFANALINLFINFVHTELWIGYFQLLID